MFRWLTDNLGTMVLALVLAIFVWVVAIQETNPIVDETFSDSIPITLLNQPADAVLTNATGTVIVEQFNQSIDVLISGPRQTLAALQASDFSAAIDLSTIPYGGVDVPITVTVNDPLVQIESQSVNSVFLRLEALRRVSLPVEVTVVGEPALGHVAADPIIEPQSITLEGPAARIDQIKSAQLQISVEGARETVDDIVLVRLRDENSRAVSGFDADLLQVAVTVPISKSEEYAELFVTVNITGTIAAGYRLADYSVDPQRVTIFGPPEVVSALPGFVSTVPVDVSNADSDLIQRVGLEVPAGVTLIGAQNVLVEIDVEPVLTSITIPWRPQVIGPDEGLGVTISPEMVNVTLVGSLALMDTFDPEVHLNLTLNLHGLQVGSYPMEPAALSNLLGVEVESVLPPTLLIEIFPLPTPTPTPTISETETFTGTIVFAGTPWPTVVLTTTPTPAASATPTLTPSP